MRRPLWKWVFVLPRLLFKLWFGVLFGVSLVVLYIPFRILLHKPDRYPAAFRLMKAWGRFLACCGLVPWKLVSKAPLPTPPYVICANHSSYIDIIHAFCFMPHYFLFMGKQELLQWPLFNIFFKDMHIAVNRNNGMEAARALAKAGEAIDRGVCVSIFPEGTISPNAPALLPFKDGAFRLAVRKQVPVVPVTFLDNWNLLGDPEKPLSAGRPGVARVVVHQPQMPSGRGHEHVDDLRRRVFEAIEAPLRQAYPAR